MKRDFNCTLPLILFSFSIILWITGCAGLGASPKNTPAVTPTIVSFTATPQSVAPGGSVTLTWQTTNATQVTIDNGVGVQPANGSFTVKSVSAVTTFNLTAQGANSASATATATVNLAAPTVTSFAASSSTIAPGAPVMLSWVTTNATQVTIDNNVGTIPINSTTPNSVMVKPTATTTYTIVAENAGSKSTPLTTTVTVDPNAPTVVLSAAPNPVRSGTFVTLSWVTKNATSISFNPTVPFPTDQTTFPLPTGNALFAAPPETTTTVVTYVATVTGKGGLTSTSTVNITVQPPLPTISFSANPTSITSGQSATLSWNVQNATSFSIDNNVGSNLTLPSGTATVTPATTTTYTATAIGGDGTQVQQQVTVTVVFITLTANPISIAPGQTTTLTWTSPNAVSVSIDNGIGPVTPATGGSITVTPKATTTYTATATAANGQTSTAKVLVVVSQVPGLSAIKHIIFIAQENRSFDNYFSVLGAYKASKGFTNDVNLDYDPTVSLRGQTGRFISPFHEKTVLTENVTPSWNESHQDINSHSGKNGTQCSALPNSDCFMDGFLGQVEATDFDPNRNVDPNGDRAIGFYDQTDLPYYYELATQFATSDRWFSPLLANTVPNREYLFGATSQGRIFPPCEPLGNPHCDASGGETFTWPTIFDAMDKANVSWQYYHIDNSIFLAQFSIWGKKVLNNGPDSGKILLIDQWFKILQDPNADNLLPSVIYIERGSGGSGFDEHPDANIQKGSAEVKKIIDALMNSSAWKSSVFILTYDEGGGLYDHVPPFNETPPDNIPPEHFIRSDNGQDANSNNGLFNQSGFRIPMIVVSPWVKPHFASHVNRDNTAILKLIETRFGLPALTARDGAQDDMSEFFDFTNPTPLLLVPPPLPDQPMNGVANPCMETESGVAPPGSCPVPKK